MPEKILLEDKDEIPLNCVFELMYVISDFSLIFAKVIFLRQFLMVFILFNHNRQQTSTGNTILFINRSPRHTHNRCAVRDIFCNDSASTDGDIVADGNWSKDGGASADVAVVANRYLPIGKVWTFLADEYHR